jgi:hypothetical protein
VLAEQVPTLRMKYLGSRNGLMGNMFVLRISLAADCQHGLKVLSLSLSFIYVGSSSPLPQSISKSR